MRPKLKSSTKEETTLLALSFAGDDFDFLRVLLRLEITAQTFLELLFIILFLF